MKFHHISFWLMYIIACGVFGYHTVTVHIPIVGMEYVYDNWAIYVLMWIGGTCFWALFYSFATLILLIDKATRIDRNAS